MTIKFSMYIKKLEGFTETEFIEQIKKNLEGVYANELRYTSIDNGYRFEVDFNTVVPEIFYQPILGCFSGIDHEYDKVELIGIPAEEMQVS